MSKIVIDAKWYFDGPPSGKRVIRALVDNILEIDKLNKYVIILNSEHADQDFPHSDRDNVSICYSWAGNNLLANLFVLPFLLRKQEVDLIVYQNFVSPFGRNKKIAYIHDVLFLSNPEFYTLFERIYFAPIKYITKFADAVITISEEEKRRIRKYNLISSKSSIYVVYHGVENNFTTNNYISNQDLLRVKAKYNLPDEFLLFVGRLNVRKNIENLLKSISILKNKKIYLVVVGQEDWKSSNYHKLAQSLNIENRIIFTGPVSDLELRIIYSAGKIFCFPSLAEGFGLPPLEAMASGVPVVVSNTTCLPEICGIAGTYINPLSPMEISSAIDSLLQNDELYNKKSLQGLEVARNFTWENAAIKIINYCSKVLNK
jgi:glycosyltransferase involved in cell wall biosynthesis